jgi:hypothetical protein
LHTCNLSLQAFLEFSFHNFIVRFVQKPEKNKTPLSYPFLFVLQGQDLHAWLENCIIQATPLLA